jgi:hypothetical protein
MVTSLSIVHRLFVHTANAVVRASGSCTSSITVPSERQRDTAGIPPLVLSGSLIGSVDCFMPGYCVRSEPPQRRGNDPARSILTSMMLSFPTYNSAMNGLTIYVDWQYFLGILGALIGLAYYANGRFTKIETTIEWLKEILLEIKRQLDNDRV